MLVDPLTGVPAGLLIIVTVGPEKYHYNNTSFIYNRIFSKKFGITIKFPNSCYSYALSYTYYITVLSLNETLS